MANPVRGKVTGMLRRSFLQSAAAAPLAQAQQTAAASSRPNVLLFCTDQQRFDTIGALGNPHIRTPHLDRLVASGVTFERTYCQTPICTPSRASFLTGCYASSLHVNRNGNQFFPEQFQSRLLPRILKQAGYDCGMVGKFHLSSSYNRVEPRLDDGYRLFEWSHAPRPNWPVEQQSYIRWLRDKGVDFNKEYGKRLLGGRPKEFDAGIAAAYHEVTWCADYAKRWIRGGLNKPWFLTVNTYAPHPPFQPPPEFLERMSPDAFPLPLWRDSDAAAQARISSVDFQSKPKDPSSYASRMMKAAYYAQVEFVDDAFGQVMKALEESGQLANTLVIFTSDHGETMGDHGLTHKGCRFYEGLAHVPLILSWPGKFGGGVRRKALAELTDLVPTILEAAGLSQPGYLHGKSLYPLASDSARADRLRDFARSEYHDALDLPGHSHANMLRNDRYKLVHYHGVPSGELFDLERDPDEFQNLWDDPKHLALRADLSNQLFDAVMLATDPGQPRIGPM